MIDMIKHIEYSPLKCCTCNLLLHLTTLTVASGTRLTQYKNNVFYQSYFSSKRLKLARAFVCQLKT